MSSSAEGSTGSRVTWRDVAEGIGIISIVASLIFVGLQVRQEAAATRSQTVLELKAAWVELNLTQAISTPST